MRQLTKTEIENAPEWATHYGICEDGDILFENEEFFIFASKPKKKLGQLFGVDEDSKPIPRKEFDIEAFEADDMVKFYIDSDGDLEFDGFDESYLLRKDSAIAIAKHFKLTADDLR